MSRTVVVAPNAFKGSLSAIQAAEAMARAVRRCDLHSLLAPVADGGEGTAEILATHYGGTRLLVETCDALGRRTLAPILDLGGGRFAVDAASACGLARIEPSGRDVLLASSYGLGLQVRRAIELGAQEIVIGVGGTAFVDGGAGLVSALGVRFLDPSGRDLSPRPAELVHVAHVDASGLSTQARRADWTLLLDVDNPLLGAEGAAKIYGPQKGAGPAEISVLDRVLESLAEAFTESGYRGKAELTMRPGTGAGGGLALAVLALFHADLKPGAQYLCEIQNLPRLAKESAAVLTGEGRLDGQTLRGKAPLCVAEIARQADRPVAAVVGVAEPGAVRQRFDWVEEASPGGAPGTEEAGLLVEDAAIRALRALRLCP